jgi:5-methylcytosine-specific restriction endonuclease McrA
MIKKREEIYNKYNGLCAYCGKPLESDWQIDHIIPQRYKDYIDNNKIYNNENLIPCQKLINHYKRALSLEDFRNLWLGKLHLRLKKLPVNPKTEKSKKRKEYLLNIANYFDITPDNPFSGKFYFEDIK